MRPMPAVAAHPLCPREQAMARRESVTRADMFMQSGKNMTINCPAVKPGWLPFPLVVASKVLTASWQDLKATSCRGHPHLPLPATLVPVACAVAELGASPTGKLADFADLGPQFLDNAIRRVRTQGSVGVDHVMCNVR